MVVSLKKNNKKIKQCNIIINIIIVVLKQHMEWTSISDKVTVVMCIQRISTRFMELIIGGIKFRTCHDISY